ncbi:sulfatase modifying factor 1 (C-alpha-formyglycine- generating enzyme 1) [Arthrobacter sp. MYb227]|uniref:formylglycine-generating enzyme family protein n=1 Tax=Arthrobacter sp. MYb227 TaxID=1848601 RepID=UPI000CFA8D92|nr:formylglycine-generating enzyme family protein [Arthrobacter sp. MYb227]PQZ94708.1 sulfatase modifying factor 1 (C-alpha-formyglycine- generating enzyme 1) [Arthrobacter sp. MYb227]
MTESKCCAGATRDGALAPAPAVLRSSRNTKGQLLLPGGSFTMGDHFDEGYPADGETPVHPVELAPFHIDTTAVTNSEFAKFIKDTGYLTDSERYGSSAVFHLAVAARRADVLNQLHSTPWWLTIRGADWKHPEGPLSSIGDKPNHPVTHVSWADAQAYAAWAGKRLPTEAEWEFAARGGLSGARYAWGNELTPRGHWRCNIWQGQFPAQNTEADGYLTTAPVKSYRPNGFGLYNTAGNVWEWCVDRFDPRYYQHSPVQNPQGPKEGESRVMRGGSFLCHDSYCNRYRVAARSSNTPDSASANVGFRCANDA